MVTLNRRQLLAAVAAGPWTLIPDFRFDRRLLTI
jgi:hypothetical protein